MPRKPVPKTNEFPYHVSARSNNKEWFYLPIEQVFETFLEKLEKTIAKYEVNIIAFVLMNNHYHMMIHTPLANLGESMNYLQREVSRAVGRCAKRINHVFGGPYHGSLLKDPSYIANCYKYIYRNPVAANITQNVQDYQFGSFPVLLGKSKFPFPLHDNIALNQSYIPSEIEQRLNWLNDAFTTKQSEAIRRGLRKSEFSYPMLNALKATSLKLLRESSAPKR